MPRVYLTTEQRECDRFSDFVRRELRKQKKSYEDLGTELNLAKSGISQRINGVTRWTLPEMIQTVMFLDTEWTIGSGNGR